MILLLLLLIVISGKGSIIVVAIGIIHSSVCTSNLEALCVIMIEASVFDEAVQSRTVKRQLSCERKRGKSRDFAGVASTVLDLFCKTPVYIKQKNNGNDTSFTHTIILLNTTTTLPFRFSFRLVFYDFCCCWFVAILGSQIKPFCVLLSHFHVMAGSWTTWRRSTTKTTRRTTTRRTEPAPTS